MEHLILLIWGTLIFYVKPNKWGDYLIVGVSTDEFNKIKGKYSIFSYVHRKKILEAIRYVDLVIPEETWEQKIQDIIDYKIDVLVMGDDWRGKFDFLNEYCEVKYFSRTADVSSTSIKELIKSM